MSSKNELIFFLIILLSALVISGIYPYDRLTWFLEVAPVLIALPILLLTYHRFALTSLAYRSIFIFSLILILGGHYTYARVPLGYWLQDLFDLSRNPYDRIGHLAQGFVPAILARELLLRTSPLKTGKWFTFIVISICLAISASYELIEWAAALISEEAAESFLGTQGDSWDTQWDMFLALVGCLTALGLLGRRHDKMLDQIR